MRLRRRDPHRTPAAAPRLQHFDYASARRELNEARECKLRADALLLKFAARTGTGGALASLPAAGATALALAVGDPSATNTAERMAREVDRRIALVSRTIDARKGRPYPKKRSSSSAASSARSAGATASVSGSASRRKNKAGSTVPSGRRRHDGYGGASARRVVAEVSDTAETSATTDVGSPVIKMLRTRRRTSIRPAELSGIRTVPKDEVPVVRSMRRRRKAKQATPVVIDKRKPKRAEHSRPIVTNRPSRVYGPGSTSRHLVMLGADDNDNGEKQQVAPELVQNTSSPRPWRNVPVDPAPASGSDHSKLDLEAPPTMETLESTESAEIAPAEVHTQGAQSAVASQMPSKATAITTEKLAAGGLPPTTAAALAMPGNLSAIVRSAVQDSYRETERRLIEAEARERTAAENLRLMKAKLESEATARQQREEELLAAREHAGQMVLAIQAIKEANTSLEVTNSALTEQIDKVHGGA